MNLEYIKVGYLRTNCYIISKNNKCLVIDPGDDYPEIIKVVNDREIVGVLVTHAHPDHVGALEFFDASLIYDYYNLEEGHNKIDCFEFEVLYTPGHKSDSLSFYFDELNGLFTGDFIFFETVGRTDLYTGSSSDMQKSILKTNIFDDDVIIYPGHGKFTDFKHERENNLFFRN